MSNAAVGEPAPSFIRHPIFGLEIDTASIVRDTALAVVFFRYSGSASARRTAMELHEVWPDLDLHDVGLVGVMEGKLDNLRDFVPRYHIKYPVVHDPEGELYDQWGVQRDTALRRSLPSLLSPSTLREYADTLQAGRGLIDGPFDRLPAAVVVAPGGKVAWRWDAASIADRLDVHELAEQALAQVKVRVA